MTTHHTDAGSAPPGVEPLRFLTPEQVRSLRAQYGTPVYVYDERHLEGRARTALGLPNAFGLTVRYSIKACSTLAIIKIFARMGLSFDACSAGEAMRALAAGVEPSRITLTGQELPPNLRELIGRGVEFNACSPGQLEAYGEQFPGSTVSIRLNPGRGSGFIKRLVAAGPEASFGIWHEEIDRVRELLARYDLRLKRVHHHVGSGNEPDEWLQIAGLTLELSRRFGSVPVINLGGGYRVRTMAGDPDYSYESLFERLREKFEAFAAETDHRPHLEIEPGTFLMANGGSLITTVTDVFSTGAGGCLFLKVDAGLTEVLRPAFYGAPHPLVTVPAEERPAGPPAEYVVAGHCAVPGDILTTEVGRPDDLAPRLLAEARAGDLLVVERAGGYCSSMSMKNFNSFLEAPEVLLRKDGSFALIRKRQTFEQLIQNEVIPEEL